MTANDSLERHVAEGLAALASAHAPDYLDDVLRRSGRTRQRHAWLPLEHSVAPVRAPHQRTGTTTWRFLHMTPMLRCAAVAAIALVLGVGLAPIIGSPGPNQAADPSASPATSPDPAMAVAWVTGTLKLAPDCTDTIATTESGITRVHGYRCEPQVITTNDPRLSGTSVERVNETVLTRTGDLRALTISVGTYDIQNEQGSWHCSFDLSVTHAPSKGSEAEVNRCVGSGSYEGLSAVLELDWATSPVAISGAIFPGEFPPAP